MAYFSYWAYFGTIYLIYLTWQDYKNNRLVDDRKNAFMMGITISLLSHFKLLPLYHITLLFVTIVLSIFLGKIKALGRADNNTLSWIFLGYGLIGVAYLLWFVMILGSCTLLYFAMKKAFKYEGYVQFYGVILISFISTNLIFTLY